MVLVPYRPGVVGQAVQTVHVVPLPTDDRVGSVVAVCGAALVFDDIDTVTPGEGHALRARRDQPSDDAPREHGSNRAVETVPTRWGLLPGVGLAGDLPGDQVRLNLYREVSREPAA